MKKLKQKIKMALIIRLERFIRRCYCSEVKHPIGVDCKPNKLISYCYQCGSKVKNQKYCKNCGRWLLWQRSGQEII